ncbi:hypothetical protein AAFF_G00369240 [Aldrovandia affinis]|uniref:Uncharacterized protein n=1 Tax=Aldrovandia affinis TaxID=143900 RepID=A0AAD7WMR5_9TELE|nr:hypothetical protein AAFF_G00369240 [Aldrovandia affinis]
MEHQQDHKNLQQKGVQWHFNPPAGSHHGGSWERLIRSVRKILNTTVKEQPLDEEGLHTLLCEAEAIINSRPITKASSDLNDLEALTPNHLVLLKVKPELPPGVFNKDDQYANRRWRQVQYLGCLLEALVQRIPPAAPRTSTMVHTWKKLLHRRRGADRG